MKNFPLRHWLGRRDVLLLAVLLALSFLPLAFFAGESPLRTAVIRVDGTEVRRIPLTTHTGTETFPIQTVAGENIVQVSGHSISVIRADCHDKICVQTGPIEKKGQVIACLPHRLLIEIE